MGVTMSPLFALPDHRLGGGAAVGYVPNASEGHEDEVPVARADGVRQSGIREAFRNLRGFFGRGGGDLRETVVAAEYELAPARTTGRTVDYA